MSEVVGPQVRDVDVIDVKFVEDKNEQPAKLMVSKAELLHIT